MGVGIFISALSMVVAGVMEAKRRESSLANGGREPMSVFWLVPQLAMVGISEAFNAVGQIEFYNQQFPDQMRSLATSLFSCSLAGASYLSSIVVTLVHQYTGKNGSPNWLDNNINAGRVDYFYYILAIMGPETKKKNTWISFLKGKMQKPVVDTAKSYEADHAWKSVWLVLGESIRFKHV